MKVYKEGEEVNSLVFWPQDEVQTAYDVVDQETKNGGELYALRRFHRRMSYFMKTASRDLSHSLENEAVRAEYEWPALEKDLADIYTGHGRPCLPWSMLPVSTANIT